ncbi:hypothetical protein [Rheinheimera pleomorphica]|uniref:hypothetical protein n=1 Tax=Rheinheimera pleomorphica TaxID=2703963 RepID=UPI00142154EE|nr:hypothetical protein [Rheinheimera pleomorphica]
MYRFLSDSANLKAVFGSYSTLEALRVKCNIEQAVKRLSIPSAALLEQMQQEGLNLADIEPAVKDNAEWAVMSETVIRSHLRSTFLAEDKLYAALSALSLSQQAEVRDLLQVVVGYLHLPSETLLKRMAEEGLTLDKLGVKSSTAQVDNVRNKLNALNQQHRAQAPLADNQQRTLDAVAGIRQRIKQLGETQLRDTNEKPSETVTQSDANDPERAAENVVTFSAMQEKLKAKA